METWPNNVGQSNHSLSPAPLTARRLARVQPKMPQLLPGLPLTSIFQLAISVTWRYLWLRGRGFILLHQETCLTLQTPQGKYAKRESWQSHPNPATPRMGARNDLPKPGTSTTGKVLPSEGSKSPQRAHKSTSRDNSVWGNKSECSINGDWERRRDGNFQGQMFP